MLHQTQLSDWFGGGGEWSIVDLQYYMLQVYNMEIEYFYRLQILLHLKLL